MLSIFFVMEAFLTAILSFPTVFFTSLVGLSLFYWLTVIVGALDIDFLSPDGSHDIGGDHGADHGIGHAAGAVDSFNLASFISLGKVPVTIIFSAFAFIGWQLSMCGEMLLRPTLGGFTGDFIYGLGMSIVVFVLSFIFTGFSVRPLRGIFNIVSEHAGITLVGRMVRITSRAVNTTFGTATCDNAGGGILMRVICRDGVILKRDDVAVVVSYDEAQQTYLVAPFSHTPVDVIDITAPNLSPSSTPATPVSLERRAEPPH